MKNKLWLTWEHQPRNISMSKALGCEYHYLQSDSGRFWRYIYLTWKTIKLLLASKPDYVFSQNPSIVLSFIAVLLRKPLGYRCIIDEHNAGLFPLDGRSKVLNLIASYILKYADLVIVTNDNLKKYCDDNHGRAIVCPDPLPDMKTPERVKLDDEFSVMLVCSWASDEPYKEVIAAARLLHKESVVIYATGKPGLKLNGLDIPENFKLTGYLSNDKYKATMQAVDTVMVLTTRNDCMNCGAYEAVASDKPAVVSNTEALRDYFHSGFEYVDNTAESIVQAIISLRVDYQQKVTQVKCLRAEIEKYDSSIRARIDDELAAING